MELALYCPVYGYYEKEEDSIGRGGDYYTSVSVGPVFGELLALQFSDWFRALDGPLCLVEAGAHHGLLARDILRWLRAQRASLFERIEYWLIEPSARRLESQRHTLQEFAAKIRWATSPGGVSGGAASQGSDASGAGFTGVLFCNELLDSMPIHRFGWDAARGEWFEWAVTFEAGRFSWTRLPAPAAAVSGQIQPPQIPADLLKALPDGFTIEHCPVASRWWKEAAGVLRSGKLVALDYGLAAEEWLDPARPQGTLRAYRRHRLAPDPLADPGEQDLTAHVDFAAIEAAGQAMGLRTEPLVTQESFLTRIAATLLGEELSGWTGGRLRQFQTLTHPNHLGHSFRVLVQSR